MTEILTPGEVAERLKIPRRTVTALCARGDLPGARKVGRCWRIPASAIDALFDAEPKPKPERQPMRRMGKLWR